MNNPTNTQQTKFSEEKLNVNNSSVNRAGIPKELSHAIAEYIWNGFDAQATTIEIKYKKNAMDGIESLSIKDNGYGIDQDNIKKTFGFLLDSQKKSLVDNTLYVHGKKGRGRFAFQLFSQEAMWETVFNKNGKKYSYTIEINADNKENYKYSLRSEEEDPNVHTGTNVEFINLKPVIGDVEKKEFAGFLKKEFGWYLHLKRKQNVQILINGTKLDYTDIIAASDTAPLEIEHDQEKYPFEVNYIEWNHNIGDKYYYYYFLDDKYLQKGRKATTLNHNEINFHHSVYVVGKYFDKFALSEDMTPEYQMTLFSKDEVYNLLIKELQSFLQQKQKAFIEKNSEILIDKLENEGVMPTFNENKYDQERKKDFVQVTKSVFKIQPKLFIGASDLHKKSFLGLLNLLLDTEERDNILKIMNGIVHDLSPQEREELAKVLETTSFNKIVRTLKLITQRHKNIQILKTLVFDYEKVTNERDNIQKIMEECFWLFGEQYNLVANDDTFQESLKKYYEDILKKDLKDTQLDGEEKNRRPDIFLARILPIPQASNTLLEENIIVELKAPDIVIGMKQYRQVEDYLNFIIKQPQFNSETRRWKFFLVGKSLHEDIKTRIRTRQNEGKEQFLVEQVGNYCIYALTWDDLFKSFELKNSFLLENLRFDKKAIVQQLEAEGIEKSELPDFLTQQVLQASANDSHLIHNS